MGGGISSKGEAKARGSTRQGPAWRGAVWCTETVPVQCVRLSNWMNWWSPHLHRHQGDDLPLSPVVFHGPHRPSSAA